MNGKALAAAFCLLAATGAAAVAIGAAVHPARFGPRYEVFIGGGLLAFLGFFFVAAGLFQSWRGGSWWPAQNARRDPWLAQGPGRSAPESDNGGLIPGATYRVIRPVTDHYGTVFAVGEELTYVSRDFLPYHGGHTLVFQPRAMYLQDEDNADVLNDLDAYLSVMAQPLTDGSRS